MITDTVEVADHLRARLGKDRILLLGQSWGSHLGIQVAAAAPHRFLINVGMAQIRHQLRSEIMAHDHVPRVYSERGDAAMHRADVDHTHNMRSVITGIFLPIWRVRPIP